MEDDEYKKLPIEERCVHKLWKARVNGYEEVTKVFRQIDDEKSPEFAKYLGLVKKFVTDSNAMGQEKGLEATLAFVENYAHAGKTVGEVMGGLVAKCVAAPKTKTRELALQVIMMYIEIEKQEIVIEELIKGTELKNPKIVSACVNAATQGLKEFGTKVISVKPLVKKIPVLFSDRDKGVRDEARLLVVELYKWIGPALRSQLNNLQPVQVTELEGEFSKVEGQKVSATRFIRSQQKKQAKMAVEAAEAEEDDEDEANEEPVTVDPYDIADPVDILSKLPKDFYDKIESKKWQERKEALEALETLLKTPRLENGDYGDVVRAMKKVVHKDSNVVVVTLGAKCIAGLANSLKKRFQTYSSACVSPLLEKFKEKKQNVVAAVREATDAVYLSTTLENVLEDVLEALNNKNPAVKSETSLFLARCFTKTLPAVLNKKLLKALCAALIKLLNDPDATVRENAAEALGVLMKLVGEKAVCPFLVDVEKDTIKMTKIRECCEKAVIVVKVPTSKKGQRPQTAPSKSGATTNPDPPPPSRPTASSAPKPVKRAVAPVKKKPTSEPAKRGKATKQVIKSVEKEISDEDAAELVADILSADILSGLDDSNWKTRLSSAEQFLTHIQSLDKSAPTQALVRIICKKPGLKDTNFQVLKCRLDVVKYLATNTQFSKTTATVCLADISEKLGDAKNSSSAGEALTAISEATGLAHVANSLMDCVFAQKSPKVIQEGLVWLGTAIKEFGFGTLNAKLLVDNAKKALASNNPAVRSAAVNFFGVLYLYLGPTVHVFLENEKPALREQIMCEFEKYDNEKPPAPIRGIVKSASTDSLDADDDEDAAGGDAPAPSVHDLFPKVDISPQITEALLDELADKTWKSRNEALTKISAIVAEAKFIKPTIGDLPQALAPRLVDSNSKIAQATLILCESLANAMGPPCKQHVRTWFPGFLQDLGDSKNWIRSASVSCINAFGQQCGYREFFEAEMIGDALKGGSPTLRTELWGWLAEILPNVKNLPKEELTICIPYLYANLEDRNADVRKKAHEAVLGIMIHLGYEHMSKQMEKLKPGSKTVVLAALDKARPNLPAKPLPKKKAPEVKEDTPTATRPSSTTRTLAKPKASIVVKPVARAKKEEEVDTSPLLVVNNLKQQRIIDESKLKVLKWNFTTPREEFVDLLRDQMANANVNKTLIQNMFHMDFKYHIKAIEMLAEDLRENITALMSNLDLILKWFTLRFFDTNPSVLLKGLEYMQLAFAELTEHKYHMLDNEASAFIPYLILKIGDPKDSVRNSVKSRLKQLWSIYSVTKLSIFIMEGVKSKNARQRAECLDVMGEIISEFDMSVWLPNPPGPLREIAKQISDRDNSVRSAALNCAVQTYYHIGEKIYKMVGQISDKDMSLLEERIKRAGKKLPAPAPAPAPAPTTTRLDITQIQNTALISPSSGDQPNHKDADNDISGGDKDKLAPDEEDELPVVAVPTLPSQVAHPVKEVTGPYKLDPALLQKWDNVSNEYHQFLPLVPKVDLTYLEEEIVIPEFLASKFKLSTKPAPKSISAADLFSLPKAPSTKTEFEATLEKNIALISSADWNLALQAIEELQVVFSSPQAKFMVQYEDNFMISVTNLLQQLDSYDPTTNSKVFQIYRNLLAITDWFYSPAILGRKVTLPVLKRILGELIGLLLDNKFDGCINGDGVIRVINMHCVKIIERSDHTAIICALVQMMHECISNESPTRLTDLLMKCLWRVIKIMPNWIDNIDYDKVLVEVDRFMTDFPATWWKNKPIDTPMRTIKTIVHSLVKMKGTALIQHLPPNGKSEIESYILRIIKSMKLEEVKAVPLKNENWRSLSRTAQTQLTEIFEKIGNRNETKEGLNLLYDFIQQNPDADIDPFLKRSSGFFQEYIQKNLKEIELQRKSAAPSLPNLRQDCNGSDTKDAHYFFNLFNIYSQNYPELERVTETECQELDYYQERIEYWKRRSANRY